MFEIEASFRNTPVSLTTNLYESIRIYTDLQESIRRPHCHLAHARRITTLSCSPSWRHESLQGRRRTTPCMAQLNELKQIHRTSQRPSLRQRPQTRDDTHLPYMMHAPALLAQCWPWSSGASACIGRRPGCAYSSRLRGSSTCSSGERLPVSRLPRRRECISKSDRVRSEMGRREIGRREREGGATRQEPNLGPPPTGRKHDAGYIPADLP